MRFPALFRLPISLLRFSVQCYPADLSALVSTIHLPPPTSSADIENLPTTLAPNLFQKYLCHHPGLAIRRDSQYTHPTRRASGSVPAVQKKGPKRLLRAFPIPSPNPIPSFQGYPLSRKGTRSKEKNFIQNAGKVNLHKASPHIPISGQLPTPIPKSPLHWRLKRVLPSRKCK